jgi:DNA replication protein DnaC
MLDNNTVSKLREMKMGVMATAFERQLADKSISELSFEERVGLMVDAEWTSRRNNRMNRLIRNAGFSDPGAALEDIEYHPDRELDKSLILRLSTCNFVEERHNIIILGASGGGKSYLANALGVTAARKLHSVRYIRLPDLLGELAIARAEGTYRKVIKGFKQVKLLILDEWLLYPLKESEARDLLEIAEARYKKASTIFCSQFDVGGWHQKIGEPTLADAICDRIVHDSYRIVIAEHNRDDSVSMRQRKGLAAI